jgi:hypothetical protein
MTRTPILAAALAAALSIPHAATAGPDAPNAPVVVELYTSQGCSSCPPADARLGALAAEPDVIGLSFHVDYWDYIGWKDPFARPEHGTRQSAYARRFGLRHVYTPQMVIQGVTHAVGSRAGELADALDLARRTPRMTIEARLDGGALVVDLPAGGGGAGVSAQAAQVVVVGYDDFHETRIQRGENAGRTLGYTNVVRSLDQIGVWTGDAATLRAALPEAARAGGGCVVLVQSEDDGRILGAAQIDTGVSG